MSSRCRSEFKNERTASFARTPLDPCPAHKIATSELIRRSYGHPRGERRSRFSVASRFFSSLFTGNLRTHLRALCMTETCVNEDQLKSMLSGQSAAAGTPGDESGAGAPSGSSTGAGTPADNATITTPVEEETAADAPAQGGTETPALLRPKEKGMS